MRVFSSTCSTTVVSSVRKTRWRPPTGPKPPSVSATVSWTPGRPAAGGWRTLPLVENGKIARGWKHTGYGRNQCVIDLVNAYLIDLEPPPAETACE